MLALRSRGDAVFAVSRLRRPRPGAAAAAPAGAPLGADRDADRAPRPARRRRPRAAARGRALRGPAAAPAAARRSPAGSSPARSIARSSRGDARAARLRARRAADGRRRGDRATPGALRRRARSPRSASAARRRGRRSSLSGISVDAGPATLAVGLALPALAAPPLARDPAARRLAKPLVCHCRSPTATRARRGRAARADLEVGPGELVVLAGRSGSGKTTLLRAAAGSCRTTTAARSPARSGRGPRHPRPRPGRPRRPRRLRRPGPRDPGGLGDRARRAGAAARAPRRAGRGARAGVEEVALALAIPHLARARDRHAFGRRAPARRARGGAGRPAAARPARRADLAARPGRGRRADLAAAASERGVGDGRRARRAPARALPGGGRPRRRDGEGRSRSTARRRGSSTGRASTRRLRRPGARMFDLAGLRPLPVGVKDARRSWRVGVETEPQSWTHPGADRRVRRCRDVAEAPRVRDLWVELDRATAARRAPRRSSLRRAGERVALMGRNGAGKSTLLRAWPGRRAGPGHATRPVAAPCFPKPRGLPGARTGRRRARRGPRSLAPGVGGLDWAADRDPRDLSGGERQRLALAIVMAGRGGRGRVPGLVCLDEPTRGMDRGAQGRARGAHRRARARRRARCSSRPTTSSSRRVRRPRRPARRG